MNEVMENEKLKAHKKDLPKGWRISKLEDLCKIQLGKTPHRKTERFWDKEKITSNVWLSIADMVHGKELFDSKEYLSNLATENINTTPKGTLIISFKLTIGRISFAGCDLFTNEAIASLIELSPNICKQYLFYYFTFFDWNKATEGDIKVKGKTLNKEKLKTLPIILSPLHEQQRIVAVLDQDFAAINKAKANAEQNLSNAKELFESYLQGVFENKGDDWEELTLKEVSSVFSRGKSKHRPRGDKSILGGEYPLIQTGDISNSEHWLNTYSNTYNEKGLAQSKLWPKGTICIAIVGANVAETAILTFDSCFPDSVIGITVDKKRANNEYVEYLLQSFKSYLKEKGKGTARDNINLATFQNQKFPFPLIKEQQQIVEKLNSLSIETKKLEAIYKQKIADLEELKKSILNKAFKGELNTLSYKYE
jgi:type I restriction enzyme S subunit